MAMFRENIQITVGEIDGLIQRIQEEYEVSEVTFVEQTNHYCKFRGTKNNKIYYYSYDKNSQFGYIIESED